jgi:EAL domain-containing protein (putative c-di-GMP-specific phosphodiesterase class I)
MNADRAMYSSKAGGKEGFRFFDASIAAAAAERHEMEQCLQRVLLDERIRCAYQPKFDFRNQQVAGVEVLMRWIDDDGFVQPPQRILQVANELGLMDEITSRIVEQTIASVDEINAAFGGSASISLNLSPQQAADFEFMRSLVNTLDRTGFADRFMLELTEEAFLAKQEFQSHILPLIRSVGARVSIDDFGVGYSSLASLAAITADEVKVDRSFITNVQLRARSQSILKAIEALGNSLGMSVVVEGVETEEELDYLRQRTGISVAQGYRFSKPVLLETSQLFPERTWQGRSLRRNRDVAPGRRCG